MSYGGDNVLVIGIKYELLLRMEKISKIERCDGNRENV